MRISTETTISDIMVSRLETVESSSTAQDAAIKMRDKQVSSVLVRDEKDGTPIGIVTERDLSRKVCVGDKSSKEMLASQIMSSPLITINADSSPSYAADLMLKNKVRHLLVVMPRSSQDKDKKVSRDDEYILKPIGIVTPMDFTRFEVTNTLSDQNDTDNYEDNVEGILQHYRNDFNFA
ncbi:MAG: CBS domain-containing protein [Nitrososphaeraceae archaeon]